MLEKIKLNKGHLYEVVGLDFNVAIWTGEDFRGPALEYKHLLFKHEKHYEDGLPGGTCKPIQELTSSPLVEPYDGINLLKSLRALHDVLVDKEK